MESVERLEGRALYEHPIAGAVMAVIKDRGYELASAKEFADRVGMEMAQFEHHFADKAEATDRVFEAYIDNFKTRVGGAYASAASWPENLRAAAYEAARWLRDNPLATWFGMVGMLDAGDLQRVRREEVFKWCAALIDEGRAVAPNPAAVPEAAPLIAVGAIAETLRRQQEGSFDADTVATVAPRCARRFGPTSARRPRGPSSGSHRPRTSVLWSTGERQKAPGRAGAGSSRPPLLRHEILTSGPRRASPHKLAAVAERGGSKPKPGLPRLPPGRHGLPREFVTQNQRDRIAGGMIQVVVELGYEGATVTHICAAAGVSRRTFYNYFGDKEEAFFEVYRQVTDFLCETMAAAGIGATGGWAARVEAELGALLACFSANPGLVKFCLVAPPEAGGKVAAAYREFLERLLAIIREGRPKRARKPTAAAEYGLVGGLAGLVVEAVEKDRADGLERLLPEVLELVLAPYLGRAAAVKAAR
jgi:AcrR family transcriptional regulator